MKKVLFAMQIGLRGILHHFEEIYYYFNPLENKWKYVDKMYINEIKPEHTPL
jgi:hypothetical protein